MQISVTINIGNFENLKLTTSEHETIKECNSELRKMIINFSNIPEVDRFLSSRVGWT